MSRRLLLMVLAAALHAAAAADPPAAPPPKLCAVLNNRILGPRSADRPLPLLQGHPPALRTACVVSWRTLSPGNQPLAVTDCYQDSLLQVADAAACGTATGPLWVSSRWVVTSAELQAGAHSPACQLLETGAWAGTRDFEVACKPQPRDFEVKPEAAKAPAADSTKAAPAAPSPK